MDRQKYIEEGKKKGLDMSWLEQGTQVASPQGVANLSPGAQQLMDAVSRAQANTPVNIPFAPGTPTLAGKQFEYGKERDLIADQRYQQQWDYQKQQDAIRNSLSRAGGSTPVPESEIKLDPKEEAKYWKPHIDAQLKDRTPQEQEEVIKSYLRNLEETGVVSPEVVDFLLILYGFTPPSNEPVESTVPTRQRDIIMEQFRPGSLKLPTLRSL